MNPEYLTLMKQEELNRIVKKHKLWLKEDYEGEEADLSYFDLSGAALIEEDLRYIDFSHSDLSYVDFIGSNLEGADLTDTKLFQADFYCANLKNVKGLITNIEWMDKNLEKTKDGYIAYKVFGLYHDVPKYWNVKENCIIGEHADLDRRNLDSYGINAGTLEHIKEENDTGLPIYKLLIRNEWLDEVVVPYGTDGGFRCCKALILEKI